LIASGIALVAGVILGAAIGLLKPVRTYTQGTVDVLRTIPTVALMPVALLVWGTGAKSEIIVAAFAAMWPITLNTAAGVSRVHPLKRDVARTFRLSRTETLRKIVFPVAMPAILVGARLSVVTALVVSIVAEMLINPEGIGYGLVFSQQALQPDDMWAYAVVAGIMGYLLNVLLVTIVRRGGADMQGANA
jgi:ABC-type nitrate/sulfonate/bicarbonate transport system permease component